MKKYWIYYKNIQSQMKFFPTKISPISNLSYFNKLSINENRKTNFSNFNKELFEKDVKTKFYLLLYIVYYIQKIIL